MDAFRVGVGVAAGLGLGGVLLNTLVRDGGNQRVAGRAAPGEQHIFSAQGEFTRSNRLVDSAYPEKVGAWIGGLAGAAAGVGALMRGGGLAGAGAAAIATAAAAPVAGALLGAAIGGLVPHDPMTRPALDGPYSLPAGADVEPGAETFDIDDAYEGLGWTDGMTLGREVGRAGGYDTVDDAARDMPVGSYVALRGDDGRIRMVDINEKPVTFARGAAPIEISGISGEGRQVDSRFVFGNRQDYLHDGRRRIDALSAEVQALPIEAVVRRTSNQYGSEAEIFERNDAGSHFGTEQEAGIARFGPTRELADLPLAPGQPQAGARPTTSSTAGYMRDHDLLTLDDLENLPIDLDVVSPGEGFATAAEAVAYLRQRPGDQFAHLVAGEDRYVVHDVVTDELHDFAGSSPDLLTVHPGRVANGLGSDVDGRARIDADLLEIDGTIHVDGGGLWVAADDG